MPSTASHTAAVGSVEEAEPAALHPLLLVVPPGAAPVPPSGAAAGGAPIVSVKGPSVFFGEMPLTTTSASPWNAAGRGTALSSWHVPAVIGTRTPALRVGSVSRLAYAGASAWVRYVTFEKAVVSPCAVPSSADGAGEMAGYVFASG